MVNESFLRDECSTVVLLHEVRTALKYCRTSLLEMRENSSSFIYSECVVSRRLLLTCVMCGGIVR